MKKKKLSLRNTIALIIIVFILGIGISAWVYAAYKIVWIDTFDIEVIGVESNIVGLNADPTLHFGKVSVNGGMCRKEMVIPNDVDYPLLVQIRVKGNVSPFIKVDDNNFILQPDEIRKLPVYAVFPIGFENKGIYTGEAKVIFFRD